MKQYTYNVLHERRNAERVFIPFPAVVEGVDVEGRDFKVNTVLDNLSKDGLYLRIVPCVTVGACLSVVFRLSGSVNSEETSAKIAVRGQVVRVDKKEGGACGIALRYEPPRFI